MLVDVTAEQWLPGCGGMPGRPGTHCRRAVRTRRWLWPPVRALLTCPARWRAGGRCRRCRAFVARQYRAAGTLVRWQRCRTGLTSDRPLGAQTHGHDVRGGKRTVAFVVDLGQVDPMPPGLVGVRVERDVRRGHRRRRAGGRGVRRLGPGRSPLHGSGGGCSPACRPRRRRGAWPSRRRGIPAGSGPGCGCGSRHGPSAPVAACGSALRLDVV